MKKIILLAITLGFLYLAARGVDWGHFWTIVKTTQVSFVAAAVGLMVISFVMRCIRWRYVFPATIRRQGLRYLFPTMMIGYFANNFLPARGGEICRAILTGRHNSISYAGVFSTIVAERVFDGLCVSMIGLLALQQLSSDGPGWIRQVALAFAGLFAALWILAARRELVKRLLTWSSDKFPGHLPGIVTQKLHSMLDYLEAVTTISGFLRIFVLTAAVWIIEIGVYALVARSFGLWLQPSQLGIALVAANFASLIPTSPGGIGTIELFATEALVFSGIDREVALVMVMTHHATQYALCLLLGVYYTHQVGFSLRAIPMATQSRSLLNIDDLVAAQGQTYPETVRQFHSVPPKDDLYISMVIPAYNEEMRLLPTLFSVIEYFNRAGFSHEIIIVDDGSQDQTARLVRELAKRFPSIKLISLPRNMGKGAAVRTGVRNATGHYIIFNDADGATPVLEIERLLSAMAKGADVVIGSRALYSAETHVERNWGRAVAGRMFAFLVNLWVVPGIADTQCGFKMFRRHVAHRIFGIQRLDGFAFDVEILRIARVLGHHVVEVPVNWTNITGSKVKLFRDSWRMARDVLYIRYLVPSSLRATMQYADPQDIIRTGEDRLPQRSALQ